MQNELSTCQTLVRVLTDVGYVDVTAGKHYCFFTDYQGNVRAVRDAEGTLLEYNAYYPYGMLMTGVGASTSNFVTSPTGSVQPYKYTGKELDRENGLDTYDFEARCYDPALATTWQQDPLADKYPHLSPYSWCAANPIRNTDPTGMDTYEINSKGFISFRQQTDDDYDRIYAADASSNYVDVGKDFIKSLNSREANSTSIDIYSSTDDLNDVFSFVKDNTIVEWSLINTTTDKGRQNYLGTSHYESSDSSGDVVLKKMLSDDSIILQHTHSHPGYSFVVSPADVDFAEDIQERFPNAKMYIAIPGTSELREYNRDTQAAVLPDLIIIR